MWGYTPKHFQTGYDHQTQRWLGSAKLRERGKNEKRGGKKRAKRLKDPTTERRRGHPWGRGQRQKNFKTGVRDIVTKTDKLWGVKKKGEPNGRRLSQSGPGGN